MLDGIFQNLDKSGFSEIFLPAIRTKPLYEIFDFVQFISVGTIHRRNMDCIKTESLVAGFAVEMAVHLVRAAVVVIVADAILFRAASVFGLVHQVAGGECLQSPEYG